MRAEFLFDPLLHLHESLLHAITRFIARYITRHYTLYYTRIHVLLHVSRFLLHVKGSYYTLITRSHASYYTLP